MQRIGQVVATLCISADTLRYYEKIGLIPEVSRTSGGVRLYSEQDLSRLRFIRRAQKIGFCLEEIASLLTFREDPQNAKAQVRQLAHQKLTEVEDHIAELSTLRDELRLLTGLCRASSEGCPILESFDEGNNTRF